MMNVLVSTFFSHSHVFFQPPLSNSVLYIVSVECHEPQRDTEIFSKLKHVPAWVNNVKVNCLEYIRCTFCECQQDVPN
jgi:hypothetical protein